MIGWLKGTVMVLADESIIAVSGVGYQVLIGPHTQSKLTLGNETSLWIYTHVREDQLTLFGFSTIDAKALFLHLLSVSGVGPKIAMLLVDQGVEAVIAAIQQSNLVFFSQVPRVGKKLAQKIVIELQPKLGSLQELSLKPLSSVHQDVLDALLTLGFAETMARSILPQLSESENDTAVLLKQALKLLKK